MTAEQGMCAHVTKEHQEERDAAKQRKPAS